VNLEPILRLVVVQKHNSEKREFIYFSLVIDVFLVTLFYHLGYFVDLVYLEFTLYTMHELADTG
jgi:hypothetical protein